MRFSLEVASAALAVAVFVNASAAAEDGIAEINAAVENRNLPVILAHTYADEVDLRGRILKFIIDTQINGVRTHKEFLLKPDESGGTAFNHGLAILDANYVEISAWTSGGDLKRRVPNVFHDRRRPSSALLSTTLSALNAIAKPGEGEPVYLFAGPFPKSKSASERKRMLKQYEKTNYILFRLK